MNQSPTVVDISKGVAAGLAAGLVATWVMNQFQRGWSLVADHDAPRSSGDHHDGRDWQERQEDLNANELAAQAVADATIHRRLTHEELAVAAPAVHYGFGTTVGAIYGGFSELMDARAATGAAYGAALWLVADEMAVPALGLSKSARSYPLETHVQALASHLVYGVATEWVRRVVRTLL